MNSSLLEEPSKDDFRLSSVADYERFFNIGSHRGCGFAVNALASLFSPPFRNSPGLAEQTMVGKGPNSESGLKRDNRRTMTDMRLGWALTACLGAAFLTACSHPQKTVSHTWDPRAAAAYLDQREVTWMAWPNAARDHDTFCVSCHTVVPYALSRPLLRNALAERGPSADERKLLDNVTKRVRLWNEIGPFYSGKGYDNSKADESRGTEAVLNALILAHYDAQAGHLSEISNAAFNNMWATQLNDGEGRGAWRWLQFGMEPWEARDSQYYGAALAAIAVGTAPENYRSTPDIQAEVGMLRDYLNHGYATQSTLNQVVLLWASEKLPELLKPEQQQAIIREVSDAQQSDGGWALSPLAWPKNRGWHSIISTHLRSDLTRQDADSDGYATGLIAFVLQQTGMPSDNPTLRRALSWLAQNQNTQDGSWPSLSLTKRRDSSSNTGHFMRDAATAYAVLALTESSTAANASREEEENEAGEISKSPSSSNVTVVARRN